MNNSIIGFIDKVCNEVDCKNARKYIKEELESHILDSVEYYKANGLNENNSINEALTDIGNPVEIGKKLNKIHKPKHEVSVLIGFTLLIISGFIIGRKIGTAELYYFNYVFFIAASVLLVFFMGYFLNYKKIQNHGILICLIGLICVYIYYIAKSQGNSIDLLHFYKHQASSISIPFFIIAYVKISAEKNSEFKSILTFVITSLLVIILLPKIGIYTSILTVIVTISVTANFLYEKFKLQKSRKYIYFFTASFFLLLFIAYLSNNVGLYNSIPVNNNANNTDINLRSEYVIQFVLSDMGRLYAYSIIGISLFMVLRMFAAAYKINDLFGRLFVISTASILFAEIILNLFVALEIIPYIEGAHLPFISYSKTNYLINLSLISLSMGIYRRKDMVFESSVIDVEQ